MMPTNRLATGNASTRVVVGLGNAEQRYARTRHNLGARAVAEAMSRMSLRQQPGLNPVPMSRSGFVLPDGYMNESGGAVKALAKFYKVQPDRIVAIHDELDIPFGTLRTKLGGGDNGHNGLRSLRSSLGTGDFFRVRVGVGRPPGRQDPADFVLSAYSSAERKELPFQVDRAADAVESLLQLGLEATQQRFNG